MNRKPEVNGREHAITVIEGWPVRSMTGLYGPLIVLEPGQTYDREHDIPVVISVGKYAPFGFVMLVNGHPQPDPIKLHTATRYRLRLINITDNGSDVRLRLTVNDVPVHWRVNCERWRGFASRAVEVLYGRYALCRR
jgi:hypothetical protein